MVVRIHVFPRREILDPQGKAIASALRRLGFEGVEDVRAGKSFALSLDDGATRESVAQMCEKLLANLVVEDYEIEWPAGGAAA
jgi:phosphoribosylformylglycinamidine synthase